MKRQKIASTNVVSAGYSAKSRVMEVEFGNGDVWQYSEVPQEEWDAFLGAPRPGQYFYHNVPKNYSGKKVRA